MGAIGEVAVQSTLLHMDAEGVNVLSTRAHGVSQKLWVRDEQSVPEGRPELRGGHGQCLGLRYGIEPCTRLRTLPTLVDSVVHVVCLEIDFDGGRTQL